MQSRNPVLLWFPRSDSLWITERRSVPFSVFEAGLSALCGPSIRVSFDAWVVHSTLYIIYDLATGIQVPLEHINIV